MRKMTRQAVANHTKKAMKGQNRWVKRTRPRVKINTKKK